MSNVTLHPITFSETVFQSIDGTLSFIGILILGLLVAALIAVARLGKIAKLLREISGKIKN